MNHLVSDTEKAAKLAHLYKNHGVMNRPLTRLVDFAYAQRLPIYFVYEKFLNSSEFGELEDRKHLMIPKVVNLVKKVSFDVFSIKIREIFSIFANAFFTENS